MNRLLVLGLIAALLALPLLLRDRQSPVPSGLRRLVVLTPHGEPTRAEFGYAFAAWARAERGLQVEVDWRTPGGTSEITRYLDERFKAELGLAHPGLTLRDFNNPKTPDDPARKAFLASSIGVGVDVLFGGGEIPFRGHAAKGYLIDPGLRTAEPTWFAPDIIPQTLSGEVIYDPQGRYYGACLAVFGISASRDRLEELHLSVPTQWEDLGQAAYLGRLTLADPTKSGAVVTACERILQQQMARHGTEAGWQEGLVLITRMVANSRWITDSASKPTRDTARGDTVASMAIDFQAKAEAEWSVVESGGSPRLIFTAPEGGTSVSADPIAVLRGAPEPQLAADFLRFVLSPAGQRLWNYRVGEPGGPRRYALRRAAVRTDVYTPEDRAHMSDPDLDPFALARRFTYEPKRTAHLYPLIGPLIKAIALDPRDDLTAAWTAIITAGGPERVPMAWARFTALPVPYAQAAAAKEALAQGPTTAAPLLRGWTEDALQRYRDARRLAEEGR